MKNIIKGLENRISDLENYAEKAGEEVTPTRRLKGGKLKHSKSLSSYNTQDQHILNTNELKKGNESYYFKPAEIAIEKAQQSIRKWENESRTEAILLMEEAQENFPENKDFLFNLGKMYLEEGTENKKGFTFLLEYFIFMNNGDHYKEEIKNILCIEENPDYYAGFFKINNQQIEYYVDEEHEIHIEEDLANERLSIVPLAFKVPCNLDFERKDRESIELLDYKFLKKIQNEELTKFEIILPKNKFLIFLSEFYATVLEVAEAGEVIPLIDFKETETALKIFQIERKYYHQGMKDPVDLALPEDESTLSILQVSVPFHKEGELISLFRLFCLKYIVPIKTEREMAKDFEEEEMIKHQILAEIEGKAIRQEEFERLMKMSKMYAEFKIIHSNILSREENPSESISAKTEDYEKYRMYFISKFERKYVDLLNRNKEFKGLSCNDRTYQIDNLLSLIENSNFKEDIRARLYDVVETMEKFPHYTLNPIRTILEGTIKQVFHKKKMKITQIKYGKETNIPLIGLWEKISIENRGFNIQSHVRDIILKGNIGSHYDKVSSYRDVEFNEASDLLDKLVYCIECMVKQYKL